MSKASEEKIIQKMENALKNREEHFKALQERLKDHVRHILQKDWIQLIYFMAFFLSSYIKE